MNIALLKDSCIFEKYVIFIEKYEYYELRICLLQAAALGRQLPPSLKNNTHEHVGRLTASNGHSQELKKATKKPPFSYNKYY